MANGVLIAVSVIVLISLISRTNCMVPGYSFTKFMGPVSGAEQKVAYYDDGKYHGHDYMAKPDYHFEYGVEDPVSNVHQSRQETRHGDTVHGEYSVLDPDGKLRTVKYTADKKNGFQASIITDGKIVHHPQDPGEAHEQQPPVHAPRPVYPRPVHPQSEPVPIPPPAPVTHNPPATPKPQPPKAPASNSGEDDEEYDEGDDENDVESGGDGSNEENYDDSGQNEGESGESEGEDDEYY